MYGSGHKGWSDSESSLPRRWVLRGVAATAGALAGCSGVTSHEFEATPVRLPEANQRELQLAETAFESDTVTREPGVGEVEGEVTITSHAATYQRGPGHGTPTVMEAFLSGVNGTSGSGAAVVVSGDALGIDDLALPVFEEEPRIAGDRWSLVVPEGARNDGTVSLSQTILLVPSTAFPGSSWIPGSEWFPGSSWVPGSDWSPGIRWMPGDEWIPADPASLRVLMATREGESAAVFDLIGQNSEDLPGRPLAEGETFETENAVLAIPGTDWIPDDRPRDATAVFDAGVPAPLRGGTFGLGVLSTPNAQVAGQSVNPGARMGFEQLLTSDRGRRILREADVTDADEVEWLRGPERFSREGKDPEHTTATLLDTRTDVETFAGVVSGEDGPWGVVVSLSRSADEDVVVAAGAQTSPLGSTGASASTWLGGESGTDASVSTWLTGGSELSAASFGALTPDAGSPADQNDYAEIAFTDQRSDGTSVTIDRTYIEQDGFITIHTWDLIAQQNGPGTIIGVSRLLETGENGEGREYRNETIELFDPATGFSEEFEGRERLRRSQRLVAVPHRDVDHSSDFNFTTVPHVDVPFTKGSQTRTDLPVDDAVNDVAHVML